VPPATRPLVSVVIDGYNETNGLGTASNTMDALEGQDFPLDQVEVILVGTTDQVTEWRATYAAPDAVRRWAEGF
jgi:hypothetical protein